MVNIVQEILQMISVNSNYTQTNRKIKMTMQGIVK